MLISLREDHKKHLSLLISQPVEVIEELCKMAANFLHEGTENLSQINSQNLLQKNQIESCVYGIANLIIISCTHKLSNADFDDSLLALGFNQDSISSLRTLYESLKTEVTNAVENSSINTARYVGLDWRFEAQVSSRSLLHQVTPTITMNLALDESNGFNSKEEKNHIIQADVNNLVHLTNILEQVLETTRSEYVKKIQRSFGNSVAPQNLKS